MTGFVSFVSAGPGDPDLLTIKAARLLAQADVVLFDDLASGPLLTLIGAQTELVAVGKRAGRASPKQNHVSQLLVDHAQTGARVVRLKSGDSGVFGRFEEEIAALTAANIRFEIVPGVPSACAAAAAAGIPLTRRLTARRVQFVTGADVTGDLPEAMNLAALADAAATTVVFMGKRTFPALARALMDYGLSPDTPAMLAQSVGHADQTLTRSTISALAAQLAVDTGDKPALILYGPLAEP